jgi:cell division protein FtsL
MTQSRENLAYDLSLFEAREDREEIEEAAQAPQEEKNAEKAKVSPAAVVRWSAAALFIVLALTAMMICNVQLTQLNDELSTSQNKLSAVQSEQVTLSMQLESRTSLSNVENYATNQLGLKKSNQSQIHYIHLADKDRVDITPKSENIFTNLINFILEYL